MENYIKNDFKSLVVKYILIISSLAIVSCSDDDGGDTTEEEIITEETILSVDASLFLTDTGNVQ